MARRQESASLSTLARHGFADLSAAAAALEELAGLVGIPRETLLEVVTGADPDAAVHGMLQVARRSPDAMRAVLADERALVRCWRLFGASPGLASFLHRHPDELQVLQEDSRGLPDGDAIRARLLTAVGARDGVATQDDAVIALRIAYRRVLCEIALVDLAADDPLALLPDVSAALADAAGAALDAALAVARGMADADPEELAAVQLAVIAMGKTGARELNYVSDVDVIFVAGTADDDVIPEHRALPIATRLARDMMTVLSGSEVEPPLWEVDAALRPEGKKGALVRSLASHLAYYDRWAQNWEFQALLKARAVAGDSALGAAYIEAMHPQIWESASGDDFVQSVQRMRERVTEHIDPQDARYQIKLGEGGLRDIEFTVQLLQLVHGMTDESLRVRGTVDALDALVAGGYIGRAEADTFDGDYRMLRLLEHRMQLRDLQRTHLMPRTDEELRVLARATGLAESASGLWDRWESIRREVREIHTRLFYRPLLTAVAALPEEERTLSTKQAEQRLAASGFRDPASALRHIGALTRGISRKAVVQRSLMPVMVRWFADGSDPDYGLLAFRRISERLGTTSWFLRMLRDSSGAAQRLTTLLSSSRYIGELMEWIPESVAWLDSDAQLRPRSAAALDEEARAIQTRHDTVADAAVAVRALRRREILRTAMGAVIGVLTIDDVARALTDITDATIQAMLRAVWPEVVADEDQDLAFAVIAMGRYGGAELGFGSDADVLFVYEANGVPDERAQKTATAVVTRLREELTDHRLPLELDADLRPEGRQGALVRSLDAYAQYYRRWSLSWEAQALLRARGVAGGEELRAAFSALADSIRYPEEVSIGGLRDIRHIKARVEGERLPQGTDPRLHLKLGPGTLSDVEWMVQLLQLQYAHRHDELRTTSTLGALAAAVEAGLLPDEAGQRLRDAWVLSSRLRSANTLRTGKTSDVLPSDRRALDAIARILGYPEHSATALEEDFFRTTRQARRAFEKHFYA